MCLSCQKISVVHAAKILNLTTGQISYLIRRGYLEGVKLNPDKLNSARLVAMCSILYWQKAPKLPGRDKKRCEPCNHNNKKICGACNRSVCLNDYRFPTGRAGPAKRCKDCERARKLELRHLKKTRLSPS